MIYVGWPEGLTEARKHLKKAQKLCEENYAPGFAEECGRLLKELSKARRRHAVKLRRYEEHGD